MRGAAQLALAPVALLAVLAVSSAARADDTAPPASKGSSASTPSTAQRDLFDRANKLYDDGKLADAEALYRQALELGPSFDVAGNLGNVEADLKEWRLAATHLSFAIARLPAGIRPDFRDALVKRLGEVEQEVARLHVRVNGGRARDKVTVTLDGAPTDLPLPDPLYVEPGSHVLRAEVPGWAPRAVTVNAVKGEAVDVDLEIELRGPVRSWVLAGGLTTGVLAITSGALAVAYGVESGKASTLAKQIPPSSPCPVGGAGATGTCASLKSDLVTRTALVNASLGSAIAGGAVGVATLVLVGVGARSPREDSVSVAPVVTARGAFVGVSTSF